MIDLSNFKYVEPGMPVPEGKYNCIISKVTAEIPKSGGEEFAKVHYKIIDGPQAGKILTDNLYLFSDPSTDKLRISEEKLNWLRKVSNLEDAGTLEQFIGAKLGVVVKHTVSNDITYANVRSVFKIDLNAFDMSANSAQFIDDDIPPMTATSDALPF